MLALIITAIWGHFSLLVGKFQLGNLRKSQLLVLSFPFGDLI